MKIDIKTKNITLSPPVESFVIEKIESLEKFIKVLYSQEYSSPSSGKTKVSPEAWVEIGKETMHHRKGPFFRAECQLEVFGKIIRAEALSKDLRLAINEVKDELQRKLKKEKGKMISNRRRQNSLKKII